jgi:hypothetical protein
MANSKFATSGIIAAKVTGTETTAKFEVGQRFTGNDGSEFIYVQANGAITGPGYVCGIDEDHQATMLAAAAGGLLGDMVGVAPVAFADDAYGWLQIKGPCDVQVAASCAANVVLAATATAGQIDDAVGKTIVGLILTTAREASAGLAPGFANFPVVGATTA